MKPKVKVGQTLYRLNTGNGARRAPQVLLPVVVQKVGRKYFTVAPSSEGKHWNTSKHNLDDWCEVTEFVAGWALYETEQEWNDAKEHRLLTCELRRYFSDFGPMNLPLITLRAIQALIVTKP